MCFPWHVVRYLFLILSFINKIILSTSWRIKYFLFWEFLFGYISLIKGSWVTFLIIFQKMMMTLLFVAKHWLRTHHVLTLFWIPSHDESPKLLVTLIRNEFTLFHAWKKPCHPSWLLCAIPFILEGAETCFSPHPRPCACPGLVEIEETTSHCPSGSLWEDRLSDGPVGDAGVKVLCQYQYFIFIAINHLKIFK